MKRHSLLLLSGLFIFSSSAFAEYEQYDCRLSPMMSKNPLACVVCGISNYTYEKSGKRELDSPSHRWITLLGIKARRALAAEEKKKAGHFAALDRAQLLKEEVIKDIKAYGYCTSYPGSSGKEKEKDLQMGLDIPQEEWKDIDALIDNDSAPEDKAYGVALKKYGFAYTYLSNTSALRSFESLFSGSETPSVADKRMAFKEILVNHLRSKDSSLIEPNEKGQGLRSCLKEIKAEFLDKNISDEASYDMCQSLAKSCNLDIGPIGHPRNICSEGLNLPNVYKKSKQLPPPPGPGEKPTSPGAR